MYLLYSKIYTFVTRYASKVTGYKTNAALETGNNELERTVTRYSSSILADRGISTPSNALQMYDIDTKILRANALQMYDIDNKILRANALQMYAIDTKILRANALQMYDIDTKILRANVLQMYDIDNKRLRANALHANV